MLRGLHTLHYTIQTFQHSAECWNVVDRMKLHCGGLEHSDAVAFRVLDADVETDSGNVVWLLALARADYLATGRFDVFHRLLDIMHCDDYAWMLIFLALCEKAAIDGTLVLVHAVFVHRRGSGQQIVAHFGPELIHLPTKNLRIKFRYALAVIDGHLKVHYWVHRN